MEDPLRETDERLMERYAAGGADAFEELFRRYEHVALAYFLRRTGCPHRAQDLYQDLFLRLHRARRSYDPARPFAPWFFRIAQRLLVDEMRRSATRREVGLGRRELRCEPVVLERLERAQSVERALESLSAEERRVLLAAKVEGRGYQELSRELGKSVAAIKQVASRAMRRLRAGAGEQLACPSGRTSMTSARASARGS